jgi:hypothetical protein
MVVFVFLVLAMLISSNAEAQRRGSRGGRAPAKEFNLEVGGFYGFQMIGWAGNYTIKDAANFGGYASVPVYQGVRAEFSYSRQNSQLEYRPGGFADQKVFDVSMEYFQLGAVTEMPGPPNRRVIPFGMFTVGMARLAPQGPTEAEDIIGLPPGRQYDDAWRFAITAGIGTKILLHERFGLRLQGRALMPFDFSGGGFFCGTGGCSVGVGGSIPFFQIDVSGGAYFVL